MKPGIRFSRAWTDEDLVALDVGMSDGRSSFANQVYVRQQQLRDAVKGLDAFKDQVHGGLFNLRFGEFGPEYASGAFDARLQFRKLGTILVQVSAQSEFFRFEEKELASEAKLYLVTQAALLDAFILALGALSEGGGSEAVLQAVSWP